jgi:LPXTG-motif cell wall-anchored protein
MKTSQSTLIYMALAGIALIGIVAYLVGKSRKNRVLTDTTAPGIDPKTWGPVRNLKDPLGKNELPVNTL